MNHNNEKTNQRKSDKLERAYWIAGIFVPIITLFGIVFPILLNASDDPPKHDTITDPDVESEQDVGGDGNIVNNVQNIGSGNVDIGTDVSINLDEQSHPDSSMSVNEQLSYATDLHSQGSDDNAVEFLNECLEDDGLDEESRAALRFNRGICNFSLKNYSIAVDDFKYAAQISGNPDTYWNLAESYMMLGKYSEASDAYNSAYEEIDGSQSTELSEKKKKIQKEKEQADILAGETRDTAEDSGTME